MQAAPLLEQSVELARESGDGKHVARTLIELGKQLIQHRLDDPRIPDLLREGLKRSSVLGDHGQKIEGLEALAALSARKGAPETGAELLGAAAAERDRAGVERKADELALLEATVRELDQSLGRRAYKRAYLRGYGRTLDVAIAVALRTSTRMPLESRRGGGTREATAAAGRGRGRSGDDASHPSG